MIPLMQAASKVEGAPGNGQRVMRKRTHLMKRLETRRVLRRSLRSWFVSLLLVEADLCREYGRGATGQRRERVR